MKPTPLPWHLNGSFIEDSYNNIVCELNGSFQYESDEIIAEQEKADGNFIIEAVEFYAANYKGETSGMDK